LSQVVVDVGAVARIVFRAVNGHGRARGGFHNCHVVPRDAINTYGLRRGRELGYYPPALRESPRQIKAAFPRACLKSVWLVNDLKIIDSSFRIFYQVIINSGQTRRAEVQGRTGVRAVLLIGSK
jgi:hypothetical protein